MTKVFSNVALGLCIAINLAACGGGGGGSSTASNTPAGGTIPPASLAALSTSNQTVASQDVASTAIGLFSTSQYALGAVGSNEYSLYNTAFTHLNQLAVYMADAQANATATGAVQSVSRNCSYGGSFTASATDADNSQTVSTGDSIGINFSSCNEGSGAVTGALSFHIDSLNGTYGSSPSNVSVTMTFGNLGVNAAAYSGAINGSITVAGARTGTNALSQTLSTNSLSVSATYGNVTRSRTLTGYSATETRTPDATYTYLSRYSVAGTLTSTGFAGTKAVSFSTPTMFIRRATEAYPYSGALLMSGASNTALRMTALSNAVVQLDLDANGDGTYESTSTVGWNTLL